MKNIKFYFWWRKVKREYRRREKDKKADFRERYFKDAVDMYAEGMTTAEAIKIFGDYYEAGRPKKPDFMKTVEKFS
jgi:hypothetical protein